MKTIDIGRGVQYAQVKERLKVFHEKYPQGRITQSYKDGIFQAVAVPNVKQPEIFYNGHSKVGSGSKALEKAETVAVGRALAFLGIMADGAIATAEEMEDFEIDETQTDEYKTALYALENELEQAHHIQHEELEWIRQNYKGLTTTENLWKCKNKVREVRDEKRKMDGNLTAKERNGLVEDKLNDEKQ